MKPVYLDHNATTPVEESVLSAMLPYFREEFGNPSSQTHAYGWSASQAVEKAREVLASFLAAKSKEIYFTSCATESNNLALRGLFQSYKAERRHILTAKTEHKSVLSVLENLKVEGAEVEYLPVDRQGRISLEDLKRAIRAETLVVSLMAANNEIGTCHPVEEVGAICRERKVFFHCDAVQIPAQAPIDVNRWNVDILSLSAHKFYGPKGVGLLYVRSLSPRIHVAPLMRGGGQEREMRPGTLNVPLIVGMARAAEVCDQQVQKDRKHYFELSEFFRQKVNGLWGASAMWNGSPESRIPNNISLTIRGASREKLLTGLMKTHALSLGSACTSADSTPSHVLKAIGLTDDEARTTIRLGWGRSTTLQDLESLISALHTEVLPT